MKKLFTVVLRDGERVWGTWKLVATSGKAAVKAIDENPNCVRPFLRGRGELAVTGSAPLPKPPVAGGRVTVNFSIPDSTSKDWVAYTEDGKVWRWASNDSCVPEDAALEYGIPIDRPAQAAAREKELDVFFAQYRAAMAARTPEQVAEERAEARAAMGPGKAMVNVVTGETWTT